MPFFLGLRARAQAPAFTLYNHVSYTGTPASLLPFLQPLYLSTASLTNSNNTPNYAAVKTFAATTLGNTSAPVTLDIESWTYGADSLTTTINRYIGVIDTFMSVNGTSPMGFYGVPPQPKYDWENISTPSEYNAWVVVSDSLARMAGGVSVFFPSAYSRDTSTANWSNYIDSNVSVIHALYGNSKPIYFYIWPQYDGTSAGEVNAQFIDTGRWKQLLNMVYSQANGAVIWTSNLDSLGHTVYWTPSMPWWTVTKEFLVQKRLAPAFVLDSLTAVYQASGGQVIHWATATDTTTAYYVVQRSADSVNFSAVSGDIASQQSYYTENSYSYTDTTGASGKIYYRLEIVSAGGAITYSPVIAYAPPLDYRSAGTGVTVDLGSAANWETDNGSGWVTATAPPSGNVTSGSVITILSADTWQNNIEATTISSGVTLVDSSAHNGTFSTTYKITDSGTVVYAGTAAQSIPAIASFGGSTMTNLVIDNPAGVSTTSGSWTLTGALTLSSGQFNGNNGGGSFYYKGQIVAGAGKLNAAGYFEPIGAAPQNIPSGVLLNNTIYHLVTGSAGLTSYGPVSITNSIALGAGVFTTGGNLTINGTTITTTGGSVSLGMDTLVLNSALAQSLPSGWLTGGAAANLTVNGTASDTSKGALSIGSYLGIRTLGSATPLIVSGTATIGGAVSIGAFAGTPSAGEQYTLLSATSVSDTFNTVTLPSGYEGALSYTSTEVLLTVTGVPGDLSAALVQAADSIRTPDSVSAAIILWPDPCSSVCTIRSGKPMRHITVYSAGGATVLNADGLNTTEYSLPVSSLQEGVYFARISGDGYQIVKRFVKLNG